MPSWITDEDKWEKAKQLADDQEHKNDYDYIIGIYKRMGGGIKGKERKHSFKLEVLHEELKDEIKII